MFLPGSGLQPVFLSLTHTPDQSRKRGTLESDLLMSTFADTHLSTLTRAQLDAYDRLLDENDWDLYYWATQPEPASPLLASAPRAADVGQAASEADAESGGGQTQHDQTRDGLQPPKRPGGFVRPEGEWADAVGAFKPAYRPVPERWRTSEILGLLRKHVESKRAGGMAFMPALR